MKAGAGGRDMITTLLVEDNAVVRALIRELLEFEFPSMSILEASDGKHTFRIIEDVAPDLVLMDIRLPDESGLSLTRRIKALLPETAVIILTSYDLPEYRQAAFQEGANFFLCKGDAGVDGLGPAIRSVFPGSTGSG
jgi:DNA-binding NarL/FixJ family response regulator